MKIVDEHTFLTATADWQLIPFRQRTGWYMANSRYYQVLFLLDEHIASVAYLKRQWGFSMLLMEAPCKKTKGLPAKVMKKWYEAVFELPYDIIELNSSEIYDANEEVALRQAGWLRPVGLFSYSLTNLIDLTKPIRYNKSWKWNLHQCNPQNLHFYECTDRRVGEEQLWLLYQALCCRKQLALWPNRQFFSDLLADDHFRLFFVETDRPISTVLVHISGTHVELLYAANNKEGYDHKAGPFLYSQLLQQLQQEGFLTFDMEKLGLGKGTANSVALFKMGIQGQTTLLLGEWARYRRHWMRWAMYFIKKYIWHRPEV